MITFLVDQSLFNLFGCCSFKGVFIGIALLLFTSDQSDCDRRGDAGDGVGKIVEPTELFISEFAELMDDVELLRETEEKMVPFKKSRNKKQMIYTV